MVAVASPPRAHIGRGRGTPLGTAEECFMGASSSITCREHVLSPSAFPWVVTAVVRRSAPPPPHHRGAVASPDPGSRPVRAGSPSDAIPVARQVVPARWMKQRGASYGAQGHSTRQGAHRCAHKLAFPRRCTLPTPRGARAVSSAYVSSACTPLSCVARAWLLVKPGRRCSVLLPPEAW